MSVPTVPTVRRILDATAAHYDLSRMALVSQRRDAAVIRPRQIAMWLARQLTPKSLPEIGRHIGGRDHSNVVHGVGVIDRLVVSSEEIRASVAAITETLAHPIRPTEERERDPLVVAIELVSGLRHPTDVAVEEVAGMARVLIGYGRQLGAVTIDDEAAPDPERLPIETVVDRLPPALEALFAAVDRVIATHTEVETARFSPRERSASEALSKSLRSLVEARSNTEA
jgi:hypothetical protein